MAAADVHRVEIKICGLTRRDDAIAAIELGADYTGFVVYAGSVRGITAMKLAQLVDGLPDGGKAIAVFVNETRANVERIAADCGLFAVQIHGDENAADFKGLMVPLWRAVSFRDGACTPPPDEWDAARYVVDACVPGVYGGSGRTADWREASEFARRYPTVLAGGLTPLNVASAIEETRPAGVDVAGGVELSPGVKDRAKMAAFIANARKASEQ